MCGIIGLLSNKNICIDFLLGGLTQLQNRGYDSVRIAYFNDSEIECTKWASTSTSNSLERLKKYYLEKNEQQNNVSIGIGHTRWATHGAKTDVNSHPHWSSDSLFYIVHNGIIENFRELRERLSRQTEDNCDKHKYMFQTETDTEVIANLLSYHYSQLANDTNAGNLSEETVKTAIKNTIEELTGTWGLVIMCRLFPNNLWATRNGSPLLVSQQENFVAISSEQSGFHGQVKNYFCLENNDICSISYDNKDEVYNKNSVSIHTDKIYRPIVVKQQNFASSPHPYPHWTLREIEEQYDSVLRAMNLGGRLRSDNSVNLGGILEKVDNIKSLEHIIFLACGTSFNASLFASTIFKQLCDFTTVQCFDGAEFEITDIPKRSNTAFILVSQSGETKDLHRCIEMLETHKHLLIGVVNVPDSMIARESHCGCYLNAGREVAVASTKAFTSQMVVLSLIALQISEIQETNLILRNDYIKCLRQLPEQIIETINISKPICKQLAKQLTHKKSLFILGKNRSFPIAREGALKIKEISYIHAEGYSGSSLKHGPFGLLEPGFPVILLAPKDETYAKMQNVYQEVLARHATVIFITDDHECDYENSVVLPSNKYFNYLLSVIPLQLIAYYLSLERGINPDFPRNLAKVVTVE